MTRPQAVTPANEALETMKTVVRQIEMKILAGVPGPFKKRARLSPAAVDDIAQLLVAGVRSVLRDEQRRYQHPTHLGLQQRDVGPAS